MLTLLSLLNEEKGEGRTRLSCLFNNLSLMGFLGQHYSPLLDNAG